LSVHVIHFAGDINGVTAERIRDFCFGAVKEGATDIRLHFSSAGGPNPDGFALYGFLRSLPVPLTIHNIGSIESMAVLPFLAGSRRIASPHSRFLIHPMFWWFNGPCSVDYARFREYLNIIDNDLERYAQIFDERTNGANKSLKIRSHLSGQEKIISATDSVRMSIAHEVAEATIPQGAVTWGIPAK
jgi:ATP-dependent protease ClpP protease subunit